MLTELCECSLRERQEFVECIGVTQRTPNPEHGSIFSPVLTELCECSPRERQEFVECVCVCFCVCLCVCLCGEWVEGSKQEVRCSWCYQLRCPFPHNAVFSPFKDRMSEKVSNRSLTGCEGRWKDRSAGMPVLPQVQPGCAHLFAWARRSLPPCRRTKPSAWLPAFTQPGCAKNLVAQRT